MKKYFLLAIIGIVLLGCKNGGNEPLPVPAEVKQLVASVTTIETHGGRTTRLVLTYEYDNNNRITVMHERYDDHGGPNSDHAYTYDTQGNLTKSTINREGRVSIFEYTYKDGAPVSIAYTVPSDANDFHNIAITTANSVVTGNVITTEPSEGNGIVTYAYASGNNTIESHGHITPDGITQPSFTLNWKYGSKKNPYTYSGNKWVLPDVPFANKNELLELQVQTVALRTLLFITTPMIAMITQQLCRQQQRAVPLAVQQLLIPILQRNKSLLVNR